MRLLDRNIHLFVSNPPYKDIILSIRFSKTVNSWYIVYNIPSIYYCAVLLEKLFTFFFFFTDFKSLTIVDDNTSEYISVVFTEV